MLFLNSFCAAWNKTNNIKAQKTNRSFYHNVMLILPPMLFNVSKPPKNPFRQINIEVSVNLDKGAFSSLSNFVTFFIFCISMKYKKLKFIYQKIEPILNNLILFYITTIFYKRIKDYIFFILGLKITSKYIFFGIFFSRCWANYYFYICWSVFCKK